MKKITIAIVSLILATTSFARGNGGHVSVHGYHKRDGTYVQPHHRTAPDGTKLNNWSHQGNVNPYTGKVGTNTDSSPNYSRSGYYNGSYVPPSYSPAPSTNQSHYIRTENYEFHNTRTGADYN